MKLQGSILDSQLLPQLRFDPRKEAGDGATGQCGFLSDNLSSGVVKAKDGEADVDAAVPAAEIVAPADVDDGLGMQADVAVVCYIFAIDED